MSAIRSRSWSPQTRAQARGCGRAGRAWTTSRCPRSPTPARPSQPGSPPVWDECPDNVSNLFEVGDQAATDAAFAAAAHGRHAPLRDHPRARPVHGAARRARRVRPGRGPLHALRRRAVPAPRAQGAGHATSSRSRSTRSGSIAGDVGGGFGTKGWQYPEHRLVLWAARKAAAARSSGCASAARRSRPTSTRATTSPRPSWRWTPTGRFLGLRVQHPRQRRRLRLVGPQPARDVQQRRHPGRRLHDSGRARRRSLRVLTNTNSTAPYRGAGRPEATYVIERLIDDAARELGLDRVELRRANLIPASAMPYKTALGVTYDCGEFEQEHGRGARSWPTSPASRRAARPRGPRQAARARHRQRRSSRRPGPSPSSPRSASLRAAAPPCSWAARTRARATRRPSSRSCTSGSGIDPARGPLHRRRHRPGGLRHGHDGLALDGDRRHRAVDGRRQGHRQGPEDRRADAGGGRGRRRCSPTARFAVAGTDRARGAEGGRARRLPAAPAAARRGARPLRDRHVRRRSRTPGPTAATSARWRSIPTPATSTLVALRDRRRRRHRDQPDHAQGPDPRRHRPGGGPGADGAGRVRPRVRPAPDRVVHGVRDAARRHVLRHGDREQPGADRAQPARAPRAPARPAPSARCPRSSTR